MASRDMINANFKSMLLSFPCEKRYHLQTPQIKLIVYIFLSPSPRYITVAIFVPVFINMLLSAVKIIVIPKVVIFWKCLEFVF